MKAKRNPSTFSLPILLSFNELAWILIFGMGLFSAHTLSKLKHSTAEHASFTNTVVKANADLSQELEKERAKVNELTVERDMLSHEIQSVTNRLNENEKELKRSVTD